MEHRSRPVRILVGGKSLDADLVPGDARKGIVLFAHGSGSGRKSPRNQLVASALQDRGFGTLLLDLLSSEEAELDERTGSLRFNIPLLTERLLGVTDWLVHQPDGGSRAFGYFGASTGGAVAMIAAAERPDLVHGIVLRGARSDLGDSMAPRIRCPTLILVGGEDPFIEEVNRRTMRLLRCEKSLVVIPHASHLFEEPGALEEVAAQTSSWFERTITSGH
jgi:pimeloyl-ACP methyl ester carboxylesterase